MSTSLALADRPRQDGLAVLALVAAVALACSSGPTGVADVDASDGEPDSGNGSGCVPKTCAELGWACGSFVTCGRIRDCADEGRACDSGLECYGGLDGPTECVAGAPCDVCSAIPDCGGEPQTTRLSGRVVTPGRGDADTGNQIGVPNALVYILRNADAGDLPPIPAGLPAGGSGCDRCEDQAELLGPVLNAAITDAAGNYTLEGDIPVGSEFLLVVKAGRFRRAVAHTLPADAACTTVEIPVDAAANPTRLPRSMSDGLAVNIPRIAVTTGQIDAMECVFEKLGIDHGEFGNHGGDARVHLYRGGPSASSPQGARIDSSTPHDTELYSDLARMEHYDMIVADCEGPGWDEGFAQRNQFGDDLREFVNRGGRLFASHLSFSWLHGNGATEYDPLDPAATGLGAAASWQVAANTGPNIGTGRVALDSDRASPRIEHFADWLVAEGVTSAPGYQLSIVEPRSQVVGRTLGVSSEEFVYCEGGNCSGAQVRSQQFSFNTPYGAPADQSCGRVAYSGFHVVSGGGTSPYLNSVFPQHCGGDLSDQEKVLLYMLFDLGACLGDPVPPSCVPIECAPHQCGLVPDGCGAVNDCGPCVID